MNKQKIIEDLGKKLSNETYDAGGGCIAEFFTKEQIEEYKTWLAKALQEHREMSDVKNYITNLLIKTEGYDAVSRKRLKEDLESLNTNQK